MDTDQIVAAILAAAQTAADGHNRADSYITNYRIMLAKLRDSEPEDGTPPDRPLPRASSAPAE